MDFLPVKPVSNLTAFTFSKNVLFILTLKLLVGSQGEKIIKFDLEDSLCVGLLQTVHFYFKHYFICLIIRDGISLTYIITDISF